MVEITEFAFMVMVISASGVMMPGPLFVANISSGIQGGVKTGIKIAVGHAIVELPLVILLGIGVFSLEAFPEFRIAISILGAIVLFIFGTLQLKTIFEKKKVTKSKLNRDPLIIGILLSLFNPFFIIWWLTIGFKLISDAMLVWAFTGILIVFALHIWMDFAWLGVVAFLASKSVKILSSKSYKFMMSGLSIMLIYFGIMFLVDISL
ncbi:MAG: LysE family translocator [Nitrosopumilus sp.]|nr:LysE family translocator [Nitrosopumilus sp.]MDH3515968.1 LysE family translocator [Nitrosopumilus sp.]MDH3564892.1 LysE family translocator [Nitrosopumilus sp.]MDH5417964.1 LysE family translocator [Nitrosopumilus sp.]MDH5554576.1 LysE family translocator [Nitrosopumilus sp.]